MAQISALLEVGKTANQGKTMKNSGKHLTNTANHNKNSWPMVLIPSAHPLMSLLCHYPRFNHNTLIQFFSSTVFVYLSFPNYLFLSSLAQLLEKGPVAAKKSLCHPHLFFWLQASVSWEKTFRSKVDSQKNKDIPHVCVVFNHPKSVEHLLESQLFTLTCIFLR